MTATTGLDLPLISKPRRVCGVTFTNKAADEIASRLRREIGPKRTRSPAARCTRSACHS
jgi:superfamily I DNA/RNA helicase